jgi:SAM-dependent methyltransferase
MNQDQKQTFTSFKDKWEKNSNLAFKQTLDETSDIFNWIISRNGFSGSAQFGSFISTKKRILDAGCGNGRVTAMLGKYASSDAKIVGIDLTASHVAAENLKENANMSFFQKDLLDNMQDLGKFDYIYCQEVLHHTSNPRASFSNLCKILEDGGEIAIYVYKQKAPLREYADDYIRNLVSTLPYAESVDELAKLTMFGKHLSSLDIKFEVPELKLLGIEAGEYDLQRFMYHFFFKCYWNDTFSFDENNAINYDWYHPQIATRHTKEEVLEWFHANQISVIHEFSDHYGITIRGIKK